jgi:hypothetical protein
VSKKWRRSRQAWGWVREPATKVAATLSLAGVVAVIVIQLSPGSPDGTTLALVLLAIALTFGALAPRQTGS